MHAYEAYKRVSTGPQRRIDLVLTLYRMALDQLTRARHEISEDRPNAARPLLVRTQLIVSALASGYTGNPDPAALNFLRLYEFVAHRLTLGTVADIDAGVQVLRTLLEGFESVRDQAIALEVQGVIPSLERDQIVQVTA